MNPDLNCCGSFVLSSVGRVPTETCSFVSVIANAPESIELITKQFNDMINKKLITQLIGSILRVLQKFHKYFNDTAISAYLALSEKVVLPVIVALNLNDSECVMILLGSSLWNCHKRLDVFA